MRDESEDAVGLALERAAAQFDVSHGWVGRQNAEADWHALAERLALRRPVAGAAGVVKKRGSWRSWSVGAGAMGVAVAALLATFTFRPHPQSSRQYRTGPGERTVITLADRSRVTLAPRTTLVVDENLTDHTRRVHLVGEALFNIAPSAKSAFLVQTGDVTTRVIGTTFDVRWDGPGRETRIAVMSGKVAASHPGRRPLVLSRGMLARLTDSTASLARVSDPSPYSDWASGDLVFHDVPIPDVLDALGRWYGYEFSLTDSTLRRQRLNASLDATSSAAMLRLLQQLLDVTAVFDTAGRATPRVVLTPRAHHVDQADHPRSRDPVRAHFAPTMEMGR